MSSRKERLKKRVKTRQFWITVAPLLILLGTVAVYNLIGAKPDETAVATNPTPSRATRTPSPIGTRPPILQATILPSPTPTTTPQPGVPEAAIITLFGPPNESSLPQDGRIPFYWAYSEPLMPRQQFILTLRQDEDSWILGTLDQANFGSVYQLLVDFGTVEPAAGTAVWQLQLAWVDDDQPLLASEERLLIFLPD